VPGGIVPPGRKTRRFGLDAARRLRRREDFERLLRQGRRLSVEGFTLYVQAREEGPPRLGMLISRKHSPLATVRNHIKRCIREAFRQEQEGLGALDMLIRPPYGASPSLEMTNRVRRAITKLKQT
jgi:ribonuclease P protein component